MKKISLLVLVTIIAFSVFAQSEKGYVYLKNGTILKGKYRYSGDMTKLNIESAGNLWVFDANEIDSITSVRDHRQKSVVAPASDSKFFYRTEIGVLAGNSENSQSAPFSFTGSANYKLDEKASLGAGFGAEFFKETYMPVYANFEYKFRNAYATPYLFLKAGYQIAVEDSRTVYYDIIPPWASYMPWPNPNQNENLDAKGGLLINPGVGYQRMFSSGMGMSVAFGYQFHRLQYKGEKDYQLDIDYNRLTIKLGIIF
ncbi:MAG: hypothetical protein ABFS16_12615 [Bacteroidota bacterium]